MGDALGDCDHNSAVVMIARGLPFAMVDGGKSSSGSNIFLFFKSSLNGGIACSSDRTCILLTLPLQIVSAAELL